jgi:hypothetical protein
MSLRSNLKKLAIYLSTKRPSQRFNMTVYSRYRKSGGPINDPRKQKSVPECNTICCALGNGIRAGVSAGRCDDWHEYSYKFVNNEDQYDWLFNYNWVYYDNTPKGAAYRIGYFLKCGIPSWFLFPASAGEQEQKYKECLKIGKEYVASLRRNKFQT